MPACRGECASLAAFARSDGRFHAGSVRSRKERLKRKSFLPRKFARQRRSLHSFSDRRRVLRFAGVRSRKQRPRAEKYNASDKPGQQTVDDDDLNRPLEQPGWWIFMHARFADRISRFCVLIRFRQNRHRCCWHIHSMKFYWFGLLGWVAILAAQVLIGRAARAKRRTGRRG